MYSYRSWFETSKKQLASATPHGEKKKPRRQAQLFVRLPQGRAAYVVLLGFLVPATQLGLFPWTVFLYCEPYNKVQTSDCHWREPRAWQERKGRAVGSWKGAFLVQLHPQFSWLTFVAG